LARILAFLVFGCQMSGKEKKGQVSIVRNRERIRSPMSTQPMSDLKCPWNCVGRSLAEHTTCRRRTKRYSIRTSCLYLHHAFTIFPSKLFSICPAISIQMDYIPRFSTPSAESRPVVRGPGCWRDGFVSATCGAVTFAISLLMHLVRILSRSSFKSWILCLYTFCSSWILEMRKVEN